MPLTRLDGLLVTIGCATSKEGYYTTYTPRLIYIHMYPICQILSARLPYITKNVTMV